LPQWFKTANVFEMSAVELAVRKVKKLSNRQAKELLGWLAGRQPKTLLPSNSSRGRRKSAYPRSIRELKAWEDSIRLTTNWEPPRMPDELVQPSRFKP
jgi:hypothetical protein